MIVLNNKSLLVEISTMGAEIQRIVYEGKERLWNGDPAFWTGRAPVLFPICGGIKDDKFIFEGKEYVLPKHGFAKNSEFLLEKSTDISATFLLKDSPQTLEQYPWHFELRITYLLRGNNILVKYDVKNNSEKTMYMSIGSHEAYACPEGIEDYDVIFEKPETLSSYELDGKLISYSKTPIIKETNTLPLYNKYFAVDALIFKDLKSRSATLRNRKTGESVSVDFDGCDYFLIWTMPGANYICLEPWAGFPSMVDGGYDITEKEGINEVRPLQHFILSHTIHF